MCHVEIHKFFCINPQCAALGGSDHEFLIGERTVAISFCDGYNMSNFGQCRWFIAECYSMKEVEVRKYLCPACVDSLTQLVQTLSYPHLLEE